MDINYFMKLQNAYGTKSMREKKLNKVNQEMLKHFEDTFDTEDVLLNNKPFKLMIVHDTDGNVYKKKIKSKHEDKFSLGDYVKWQGQVWLITLLDSDDKTWNRGYMYQCTVLLRWQNKKGKIIERYCYSEDFTKYSTGVTGNSTVTLGDYQYGLTLPVDDETKIIKRDKRFPIDIDGVEPPDVYKLTNRKILLTDDRAFGRGGILTWTLSYSEFNKDTDKLIQLRNGTEVWICDYKEPTALPLNSNTSIVKSIITGNKKLNIDFPRTYTVSFTNEDNVDVDWSSVNCTWNIVSNFDNDLIKQTVNRNQITLFVDDENLLDEKFKLQILVDNSVISETTITIDEIT